MTNRTLWYADGLRWIGSIFNDAAETLERNAVEREPLDPQTYRAIDGYFNDVRTRVHVQNF